MINKTTLEEWDDLCLEMREYMKGSAWTKLSHRRPRDKESAEISKQTEEYLAKGGTVEELAPGESKAWFPRFDTGAYLEYAG